MTDRISADASDAFRLASTFERLPYDARENIVTALKVTSIKTKKDWQEPLKGSSTLPALPYAIGFDITSVIGLKNTVIKSEVGFDKDRPQGALGNVSEFGTPTVTGRGFGIAALEKNQDDFVRGLEIAVEQAERKAGL